jgi:hypothetical protein
MTSTAYSVHLVEHSESSLRFAIRASRDLELETFIRCSAVTATAEKAQTLSRKIRDIRTTHHREVHARLRVPRAERGHHTVFDNMRKDQQMREMAKEVAKQLETHTREIVETTALHMRGTCTDALADPDRQGWLALDVGGERLAQRSARGLACVALRRAIPDVVLRKASCFLASGVVVRAERAPFTLGAGASHRESEHAHSSESITGLVEVEVDVTGLAPDCAFEVRLAPTDGRAACTLTVRTDAAAWQRQLHRAGLEQLIAPFAAADLVTPSQWAELVDRSREELAVRAAALGASTAQLHELEGLVAQLGYVTKKVQLRLLAERGEMNRAATDAVAQWHLARDAAAQPGATACFVAGDSVRERDGERRCGVVVGVDGADGAADIAVRFDAEDLVEHCVAHKLALAPRALFMSHAQGEAQNQCLALAMLLSSADVSVWYDMDAERLAVEDMCRGVATSRFFLIYLTKSYFTRWFCRLEAQVARELGKELIVVYESDPRHGGDANFIQLVNEATKLYPEWREYMCATEAIPMARRLYQRKAIVAEIARRVGIHAAALPRSVSRIAEDNAAEVAALQGDVGALRNEVASLRQENKELWAAIAELRRTAAQ